MASKKPAPPASLGRQLNFTTGRVNALCQQVLDPHGLTLPQWVILSCLWREGALPVSALADLVGTGVPATSRLIDRMLERGLVTRRQGAQDGRVALVDVTEAGQALSHLSEFYREINDVLCDGFTDTERAQAFDLLARMERNVNAALK